MRAGDIIALARSFLDDTATGSGQRFSDATMLNWVNVTQRQAMRDVMFPGGRLQIPTVPNYQEYQLTQVLLKPISVYLNGQLLIPSDIPTLEGQQILYYDQGYLGGNPAPVSGSGAPPSTLGPYAPSWGTVTPQGYPAANYGGWPAPNAQPATPNSMGQRGRWYNRWGSIGITPAPSMSPPLDANGNPIPNLVIDGIFLPPNVAADASLMVFPDHFDRMLAWGIVVFGKFSDDSPATVEARNYAKSEYRDARDDARMFVKSIMGNNADGVKVQTSRGWYTRAGYRNRGPRGGGSYP